MFKELSETRQAYELNRKDFEESVALEQDRLKKELAAAQKALADVEASAHKQAEKDAECIKDLQGQLERRLDESTSIDEKLLSKLLNFCMFVFVFMPIFLQPLMNVVVVQSMQALASG